MANEVAIAQFAFKRRYESALLAELAKFNLPRFGWSTPQRQIAAVRALNAVMYDYLTGQIAGCA